MSPTAELVSVSIFWVLAALCVCLPPRYGVVAYILLAQFDLGLTASYSDSSLGWQNALKVVVISSIVLLRIRPIDPLPSSFASVRNFWLFLVLYAGVAVAWSPYRLSGLKMMGYFYAHTVLFVTFTIAWRRRWFQGGAIVFVTAVSLLLAVLQTYVLGNAYGDPGYDPRFTSFTGAQSFAPFLLCMFVLLILQVRRTFARIVVAVFAAVGVFLTGSRYSAAGLFWVILVIGVALAHRGRRFSVSVLARNILLGGAGVVLVGSVILYYLPKNRVNELVDVFSARNASVEDVNTFAWRLTIYVETLEELSGRSWPNLLVGSGTSSGATVGTRTGFAEADVDPNRILHDEFLRCLYEWGIFGLVSFLLFLGALLRLSFRLVLATQSMQSWASLAVAGPLLLGLLIENIFALGGSAGGVGFCLVFASVAAQLRPALVEEKVKRQHIVTSPIEQAG